MSNYISRWNSKHFAWVYGNNKMHRCHLASIYILLIDNVICRSGKTNIIKMIRFDLNALRINYGINNSNWMNLMDATQLDRLSNIFHLYFDVHVIVSVDWMYVNYWRTPKMPISIEIVFAFVWFGLFMEWKWKEC